MTDTAVKGSGSNRRKKRGFFGAIGLFFAQVIQELKKVVSPTRKELVNYWLVVLAFVVLVMVIVGLLDLLFGQLATWSFIAPGDK